MSSNRPSIFTARESFHRRPSERSGATTPTSHPTKSSRRQSTPETAERKSIQATPELYIPSDRLSEHGGVNQLDRLHTSQWKLHNDSHNSQPSVSPGGIVKGRSVSASHTLPQTPPREEPPHLVTPWDSNNDRKRHHRTHEETGPTSEPSKKRQKVHVKSKSKHFLDSFPGAAGHLAPDFEPPSPLFFSNSPRPRPTLPPRFSSAEAGAKMLSKARLQEDSHSKTVSLARGVVTTPSAITSAPQQPHTVSRLSSERRSAARSSSPELGNVGHETGNMLNSIGIIELLEQDERPTFIVDLGVRENYGPGPLQIVFANSSLRSYSGLEALICGIAPETTSPSTSTFVQFKSWLMSAAINGESLEVCLPSFVFANMSWNCSTLRKKLRIISGAFLATPASARPSELRSSKQSSSSGDPASAGINTTTAGSYHQEPNDYFGDAGQNVLTDSARAVSGAVPSIEPLPPAVAISSPSKTTSHANTNGSILQPDLDPTIPMEATPPVLNAVLPATAVRPMQTAAASPISPAQSSERDASLALHQPCFDWTRLPVSDSMPEHIQFARSIDWGATALGPIETWNSDLRQMCNLIMASPHPAAMYWGDELVAIYNEAYVLLAGQKHPSLMGTRYADAWSEIWDEVKDVFASAQNTGEATMKDDDCLFMKRNDYLEETYFSWSIIPLVGRDGSVMGLYNPAFEKTRRKIAERRMLTLREVGERTASAREVKAFWNQVLGAFEFNEYDSPFLLLYSVSDESESDSSSIHSNSVMASRQCILEGKLGVPDDHPAAAEQIDLKAGAEGFGIVFRDVVKTDKPLLLEVGSPDLPESLVEGLEWRGFGDPIRTVVVCPIHPTTGENILGFLVLGVNPRRPYDDDYALFVQLLSRQLATSLASVVLFEEEIKRGQKAAQLAALDRIELSEQLAQRIQEAEDSETKFSRMAEFAPVGMVIAGPNGMITFANDTWYHISGVPKGKSLADTWLDYVKAEDRDQVQRRWETLTAGKQLISSEFRFKAQWEDRNGNVGDAWVLLSGYPEKYSDGRVKSVFACFTNISQQKWAEDLQKRKMEEAVELKRQQENFIDITSHEMRNPLSAILQCSDEISSTLTKYRSSGDGAISDEVLTSCLDAAQIISLCSQHQKRIVDDILTLSKLDSQLLLVTPVDAQPLTVVQRALKMHESELQASDIEMQFVVDQSYRDMDLDWVRMDPSRVLQVLINLTTNAIKFTGSESHRTISVTVSAYQQQPSTMTDAPVKYFPSRRKVTDLFNEKDWGDGELVYIHFAVRDTGRGLNPEEKKMLFMRFSQASPRTHVQYGGSGLGLFISRELTEMQGGEIGVESEAGKGSTFAFYIVTRRSSAPLDDGLSSIKRTFSQDSGRELSPAVTNRKLSQTLINPSKRSSTPASTTATTEQIRRVLIVEDNVVNAKVLTKQLKNVGTEVHLANHGGEALERLRQSTYWADPDTPVHGQKLNLGVVLMDQEMPVMDGLTCTRKIRQLEREGKLTGHVPIIAVTANARPEQIQTALDGGVDDVQSKPFRIPDLIPKIEELMERYPAPSA